MPIQVSPGMVVTETDLTTTVVAQSTTAGGFSGTFQWGPVMSLQNCGSASDLVNYFGTPNDLTAQSWFTASNFLGYTTSLYVVRTVGVLAKNAAAGTTAVLIKNSDDYTLNWGSYVGTSGPVAAKYPGAMGNSLRVVYADASVFAGQYLTAINVGTAGTGYSTAPTVNITGGGGTGATATASVSGGLITGVTITSPGYGYTSTPTISFTGGSGTGGAATAVLASANGGWPYAGLFTTAPSTTAGAAANSSSNDEMHIVVIDQLGLFSGTPGTILETYPFVSKAVDAKNPDGTSNYYKTVLNSKSAYVWFLSHPTNSATNWGQSLTKAITFGSLSGQFDFTLVNGVSDDTLTDAQGLAGYAMFTNKDSVKVSLLPLGGASTTVATYVIGSIAGIRKDCVAFVSPKLTDVVNNIGSEATSIITTRNLMPSSTYAVMDSGWKYQYDQYNDVYRWIPLNGDIAGLCALVDYTNNPWWSPAGVSRGQIQNVVKLAYSPSQADRDRLYPLGINPVVTFSGQGTFLFGDKTMTAKPSAFGHINVRRLFINLEQSIYNATSSILFEFNDAFTQAQFVSMVTPYLRTVQGGRGITGFKVVCDSTNNTQSVVDANQFVGTIYVQPNFSINYITLNFVADPSGSSIATISGF